MLLYRKPTQCDKCPVIINNKNLNPNADLIQNKTRVNRIVNSIKYSNGGTTTFGDNIVSENTLGRNNNIRSPLLPLRNKF